jgi:tryptophan halogenase
MDKGHQQHIVVPGGGMPGSMCAIGLSRMLDLRQVSITLVESDEVSTTGGEVTIPSLAGGHALAGDRSART